MDSGERVYFCIDMKSFYASVECAERGLDPFRTNLVVADVTRGRNALCLAITPAMKALGVKNRCRLSDIPRGIKYEIAPPRMALYIEYAADIYSLYLDYFDPRDIHVYSIDEAFIDAGGYLKLYGTDAASLARLLMRRIEEDCGIPSTAGIGTNLYLAKIALDITAKHAKDRIGYLDEETYRRTLWDHEPITDFWMIASGTARRLERYGVTTMRGVALLPSDLLYKAFGRNAELLIDHAWGRESCLMKDIKNYRSRSHSVSFSQILPRDYTFSEARTVMREMVLNGCAELMRRRVISDRVSIFVGYSNDVIPASKGGARLSVTTDLSSFFVPAALKIYDEKANRDMPVRRLGLCFDEVYGREREGYDLFTDFDAVRREKRIAGAVLGLRDKYGKNAVMRGTNYLPEGTQRERNGFIGGHRAGYDDKRGKG